MTEDSVALARQNPASPAGLPVDAVPYARALWAILAHPDTLEEWEPGTKPHADDTANPDERPVHRLLMMLLRRAPRFAEHFFPGVPEGEFWEGSRGFVDIIGGHKRWVPPTCLIELKFRAQVSRVVARNQFDAAVENAADGAVCYVVVPGSRAGDAGDDYRAELVKAGVQTASQWKVVTWQAIRAHLAEALGDDLPDPLHPDEATEVALVMARLVI